MRKPLAVYTIVFLLLIHILTGCDLSYRERQAKQNAEYEANLEEEKRIEASIIQTFNDKHNPVRFPDASISGHVFTYNIQEFFKNNSNRLVLFKGFVEDVEGTDNGLVIKFSVIFGSYGIGGGSDDWLDWYDGRIYNPGVVTFRLSSNQAQAKEIINNSPDQFGDDHWNHLLTDPNYYVVCKVNDVKTISNYELKGDGYDTTMKPITGVVVSGEMIDMYFKKRKKR